LRLTLRLRQLFHTQISSHWFFCISWWAYANAYQSINFNGY
jgi:hypothetical protein